MAKKRGGFFDLIESTLKDIQNTNKDNPNEPTADSSVFDLLKKKIKEVSDNVLTDNTTNDGNTKPTSIFDIIKNKIEDAREENKNDPKQPTAPSSIFDILKKKVENKQEEKKARDVKKAEESIQDVIDEYNIDVSMIEEHELKQIQERYLRDNKQLDEQYANFLRKTNAQRSAAN